MSHTSNYGESPSTTNINKQYISAGGLWVWGVLDETDLKTIKN